MAALGSTQFDRFAFPLSNPPLCNSNVLWPSEPTYSIPSLNASGSQKIRRPAAAPSRSSQIEADSNTAARAEDYQGAHNDNESVDDFPSLEELSRAALRPKVSTTALKTGPTLQRPEQPALQRAGLQVDRAQLGPGSRDQPVILDIDDDLDEADAEDEAEGASSDVDTGRLERDASVHDIFAPSELASAPIESIDASGPWYDVEEGHYIDEPAPGLEPREQHSIPYAPAQAQSSTLQQDQTNQQSVSGVARSASVEPAPYSLPKPSNSGDGGWTDEDTAELEKELGLSWEEPQVELLSACTPPSPSFRSVKEPQNEIQSRERIGIAGGILEELRDAFRHSNPAQDREWAQRETQVGVEGGAVAVQQQEELGQPAVGKGDQQDLVDVDADEPRDREATEALPATQPEIDQIDKHRFRLRGVQTRQLPGRQTKTTQYRLVWGQRPNRSDSWLNEDDVQILMPCVPNSQDLALPIRVRKMRSNQREGRKVFEYLVDAFGLDDRTWITEDQLRISVSPILVLELKGSSPLSEAQCDVLLRHSATSIGYEHGHAPQASRSSSASADPALKGEPATRKRGHQDAHTEISSDTHHSTNTDNNHDAYDTSDEDPRPAKRRKLRLAPAVTSPLHLRRSPHPPSTTATEIEHTQSQDDHRCSSNLVDNSRHRTSQASRSPSAAAEAAPAAEHQEWPFQGFLKRTRIGDDVTYNLEFKLPSISEPLRLPVNPNALDISHDAVAYSQIHQAPLKPKKSKVSWVDDDRKLAQMWTEGRSWEYIFAELPHRSKGSIRVRCSTKFKNRSRTKAGRS